MTRIMSGDDASQSAKHIDESEKLRNKFTTNTSLPTWKFGVGKFRGSSRKAPNKGFASIFTPYGEWTYGQRSDCQHFPCQDLEVKKTPEARDVTLPSIN